MRAETGKLPQARQDELFVEQMDEGLLVYDAKHFCAHRLNSTAAWTWRHCDGQKTIAEATRLLADELQQPVDEELVWLSLESLDKARLLSTPLQRPSGANDDSRRAMIQKMAMAGGLMFLLPVITPLTKAARADSPLNITVTDGPAITGITTNQGNGVRGEGFQVAGVSGKSEKGFGVEGRGPAAGVFGISSSKDGPGIGGRNFFGGFGVMGVASTGAGVYGSATKKGGRAGLFEGDVEVTGDIRLLNADCAEDFDIASAEGADAATVEAGTVMVLCDEGALQSSQTAYDKRVAGVISGAGDFKPGLILDKKPTGRPRQPVALMGKVFCKADARYGAIEAGDLLTTSDTPGHAMKAADPMQAFGAVVGKALRGLPEGQGLIPILVSL
jgi:hypothetical protein